jgi:hypothetical protein
MTSPYNLGPSVQSRMILSRYSLSAMPSARAATLAERTVRLTRLAMSSRPGPGRPSGSRTARPSVSWAALTGVERTIRATRTRQTIRQVKNLLRRLHAVGPPLSARSSDRFSTR